MTCFSSCYLFADQSVRLGRKGWLAAEDFERVEAVLRGLGLPTWHASLDLRDGNGRREVFNGLEEFREHLGGRLTVLMLNGIGSGFDVNDLDGSLLEECMEELKERAGVPAVV